MGLLKTDCSNTTYCLDEAVENFQPDDHFYHIWQNCERASHYYQIVGMQKLLLTCEGGTFASLLSTGAFWWAYYLIRVFLDLASHPSKYKLSNNSAFLGALASGDFDTAAIISLFSSKTFYEDEEDGEDFLYTLFLHKMLLGQYRDEENLESVLESYLDEAVSGKARPAICKALYEKDPAAFDEAMDDLIDEREQEIALESVSINREEYEFMVRKDLFIEGIALVKLANKLGLETPSEYRYVPEFSIVSNIRHMPSHDKLRLDPNMKNELQKRFVSVYGQDLYTTLVENFLRETRL